ncbi:LysR substrate-binding domain-containing protein [Pseudoalteromonas sp. HM-SA03]|uniref:LysR substrate-binding domain-containing protein n=1 Tax=Pseudoalteromonas sp. HM-SA03 TaxID=2029678 RepID=UPI0020D13615|nr:LysR substrate-binding domain-containing protein [Pseudoalteromonas sp. HM-SA03]
MLDELHEFQQNNPYLTLSINTTYALSDLEKSEADVVIRASHTPDEHLIGHRLFPISLGYFMHKDHLDNRTRESLSWIAASVTERPTWLLDTPYPNAQLLYQLKI